MSSPFSSTRHSDGFILQLFLVVVLAGCICLWAARNFVLAPSSFPVGATITVNQGDDLGTIAYKLKQGNIIRSPEAFKLFMLALGSDEKVSVGLYRFDAPITMVEVALKISGRSFGILQNKVTFPEGFTNADIAARMANRFPGFDAAAFTKLSTGTQGYLFPDTYSFDPSVTPEVVLRVMQETFTEKTAPLEAAFTASKRSKKDIVIMASILEKEAAHAEEMPIIAGILWKRIDRGIALQVDATLTEMLGKTSAELTLKDLANPSPYNTYVHRGLPPGPINNPGIAALTAALNPVESPYFYYLHDASGQIHYASTFEGHKQNKAKYLK